MYPVTDAKSSGSNQLTEAFVQILLANLSSHECFSAFKKITL